MSDGHDRNYEAGVDREIDLKGIVYSGVGLALIVVAFAALMWAMSLGLLAKLESADPAPPVLLEARTQELPPEPRLQTQPEEELREMRRREDEILEGYTWVNETDGVAWVPIVRAMELMAQGEGGS